jgi:nitronate monooxygenase
MALVPAVADAVGVPVIAAGGIGDRRGVVAALALGASGVQIGTAFLATAQSGASDAHKAALRDPAPARTVLTRAFSGRLARSLHNRAADELPPPLPYPYQAALLAPLRAAAMRAGRSDLMSLWSGQAVGLVRHADAGELFDSLVN